MGQIQSYYRILGLEATASASDIQAAIQKMRDIDTEGNYSAILNKIEKTLLPRSRRVPESAPIPEPTKTHAKPAAPQQPHPEPEADAELFDEFSFEPPPRRPAHAAEAPGAHSSAFAHDMEMEEDMADTVHQGGFLDFGEKEFLTEPQRKRNQHVKDHRTFITEEEIRAYNKPPSLMSKLFSGKNLILLSLGLALLVAGVFAGLPVYHLYLANKQSGEAMPVLMAARDDVAGTVRRQGYFPDHFSRDFNGQYYTLQLDPAKENITLTFSHHAADHLQGHSLIMSSYIAPNLGLQWRCDVSSGYPANLRPAQCF